MTESDDDLEGPLKRFDVELLIVHPTWDPEQVTAALRLAPAGAHRVGDQRVTPKGRLLPGNYHDTRWRYSERFEVEDQWFAGQAMALLDRLAPHKEFFSEPRSTGGSAIFLIQFLCDGYHGDNIPRAMLAKLVELELDLGIECFGDSRS